MRYIFTFLLLIILCNNSHAQGSLAVAKSYLSNQEYRWYGDYTSRYIGKGEFVTLYKSLRDDTDYAIVAWSDCSGVSDIDIFIYDADGTLVSSHTSIGSFPALEFSPLYEGTYKIRIKYVGGSHLSDNISFIIGYD
jgi:hypothetical protein